MYTEMVIPYNYIEFFVVFIGLVWSIHATLYYLNL